MAARRLIMVLVALFAISVVAAAIAPDRRGPLGGESSTESSTTTTTSPKPARSTPGGEALNVRIEASPDKPETVEGFVGDQLGLVVGTERPTEIEIPDLGVTEFAVPDAPATFDLLLREAGKFEISDADDGEVVGRLVVAPPRPERGAPQAAQSPE